MIKQSEVSYTSINQLGRNGGANRINFSRSLSCCRCHPWLKIKSCLKSCYRLPWATLFAVFLSFFGIALICISLMQSTVISDQFTYQLFNRKYLWFNDLKVAYFILCVFISALVMVNLVIGCVTSGPKRRPKYSLASSCYDSVCVIKTVFIINYMLLTLAIVFILTLGICLFAAYTTSSLCQSTNTYHHNDGDVNYSNNRLNSKDNSTMVASLVTQDNRDPLNLLLFQPLVELRKNETELLILSGQRLVIFCDQLVPTVLTYVQLCFIGLILLIAGLLNFILTVNTNWTKISAQQKFEEVVFLNSVKMTNFDDME